MIRTFRFIYEITPWHTASVITNQKEIGNWIHKFLFTRKVKLLKKNFSVKIFWDDSNKKYRYHSFGEIKSSSKLTSILLLLDQDIRKKILRSLPKNILAFHSAVVFKKKRGILILGKTTSGKSTALLQLIQKKYGAFSDELNFLDLKTLRVSPYFRSWIVKDSVPHKWKRKIHTVIPAKREDDPKAEFKKYYLFPQASFQKKWFKEKIVIKKIYVLQSRTSKINRVKILSEIELLQAFSDHVCGPFLKNYLVKSFKQIADIYRKMAGFSLQIKKRERFSNLIDQNDVIL